MSKTDNNPDKMVERARDRIKKLSGIRSLFSNQPYHQNLDTAINLYEQASNLYQSKGQIKKAIECLDSILKIESHITDFYGQYKIILIIEKLAELYLILGEKVKDEFEKTIYFQKHVDYLRRVANHSMIHQGDGLKTSRILFRVANFYENVEKDNEKSLSVMQEILDLIENYNIENDHLLLIIEWYRKLIQLSIITENFEQATLYSRRIIVKVISRIHSIPRHVYKYRLEDLYLHYILCQLAQSDLIGAQRSLGIATSTLSEDFLEDRTGIFLSNMIKAYDHSDVDLLCKSVNKFFDFKKASRIQLKLLLAIRHQFDDINKAESIE